MGTQQYDKWIEIWRDNGDGVRVKHETIKTYDLATGVARAKVIASTGGKDVTIRLVLHEILEDTIDGIERGMQGYD